jgi:nitroreductase
MNITDNLKWRYATKKFDTTKKISGENIEKLKEAVQYSVSSYGLQLYKILVVEDPEIRKKLRAASYNQPQITDASQLFIFCNYSEYKPEHIDEFINLKSDIQGIPADALAGFGDFLKGSLSGLPNENYSVWTAKQTYIALSTLIAAASELKIDTCPMEGFDSTQYNEILGLKERGLNAAVIVAAGYRSEEDETQHLKKVRKSVETLFETV